MIMSTAKPRRRRRVLIAVLTPVLVLIAAAAPLAHLTFLRSAEHTPDDFLAGDRGDKPVVVLAGARSVHGIGSADFVSVLRERMGEELTFVNAGHNGDTAADLLARADDIVAVKPDHAAVLVGTNNVLAAETDEETALTDYRRD